MPKASVSSFPISAIFAVAKPSGPTSMSILHDLQQLIARSRLFMDEAKLEKTKGKKMDRRRGKATREAIKIGQGGTLDPLASGVLVVGVGKGTKKLSSFLNCTKEYQTTCLLGCETDTYDSEGKRVRLAPWHNVTQEQVQAAIPKFTGDIQQKPPIFSALKMDGRPLHEYARKGIPLPRPIEPRPVTVHSLEMTQWLGEEHTFTWPKMELTADEKKALEKALRGADSTATITNSLDPPVSDDFHSTAFVLNMKVSGGTYVRSIVHDLSHEVGSAGHVVTLTRSRQGRFTLNPSQEGDCGCVPWEVFDRAMTDLGEPDEDGWHEWEREVLKHLEVV